MKKVKIFLLFILVCSMAFGQKGAKDYFERANHYYYQDKLEKALEDYQYIVKHYPRNKLYPSALYNAAHCSFRLERYDQSAGYCRELLGSKVNDREWVGGSIMSNPYANYRHRAARILSDCFFEQQQWDSAYHYLALSDTVYPLISMCGNASAENRIALVVRYAKSTRRCSSRTWRLQNFSRMFSTISWLTIQESSPNCRNCCQVGRS